MNKLREIYDRLDQRIRELSRTRYAILIGLTVMNAALIASTAIGKLDTVFAVTIGITMTIIYYLANPNKKKQEN